MFFARAFTKSHKTRQAVVTSLDASATAADVSGGESAGNSAPASRNLAEFSRKVDDVLNGLECNDLLSTEDSSVVDRLEQIGDQYRNSSLPDSATEWTCSTETAKLVQLSAQASNDVYKTPEHESVDGNRIFFPPKIDGTFKATLVVELNNEDGTQVLMISIRGSAPKVIDWITNVNCDPVMDGNSFLPPLNDVGKGPVAIHNGFLRVATSMASQVEQILQQKATSLDDPSTVDLVFTGHSAGGAVAALLFAHMLTPGMEEICSRFHNVHCITFGAPPIFTPSHLLEQYLPASSLFISVINQGDPIPRTDKLYLHALVDLYAQPVTGSTDQLWSAPPLTIFNAGTLVVLRIEDEEQPELDVHAYCIQAQDVQGLLAVRLAMHKKRHYVEMVDAFVKRL